MPVRQMAREVIRTKYRYHSVRLVAQHGGSIAQRAALLTRTLAIALYRDCHLVDHAGDFSGRLPQGFAGLFTDAARQFIGVALEAGSERFEYAQALLERTRGPGREGLARSLHCSIDLPSIGTLTCPQHLLGDRVQRFKCFALPVLPGACDIQRAHYFDSRGATGWADNATART